MSNRTSTEYNALVGYTATGNAVILNETFEYSDNFHGATGAILELVSQERYDEATSEDGLAEQWEPAWRADAGSTNGTTLSLKEWIDEKYAELTESVFDGSYGDAVPAGSHVATNCIAAGRIFPEALDEVVLLVAPELAQVIRDAEAR